MITLFLFIVFLGGLTFQHYIRPQALGSNKLKRFRVPLIVTGILVVPLIFFNVVPIEGKPMSSPEYIEHLKDYGSEDELISGYIWYMESNPKALEIRFEFIREMSDAIFFEKDSLRNFHYSSDAFVQQQSVAYAEAYHFYSDTISPKPVKNAKYSNYILAIEQEQKGRPLFAKLFYYQELEKNPRSLIARKGLLNLCRTYYPNEYKKYLRQERFIETFSLGEQRYLYFTQGKWKKYFGVINRTAFGNLQILAIIAALAISILWLIFVRSLDIFNKESWRDILIVFIASTLFTHFCLLGYDIAHYVFEFNIDGTVFNDFFYCTFVIGFSEELVKLIPWGLFLLLTKKAKEPYDYLLYASVSALGFAFAENFAYLENPGNITLRAIMSTVGHMFFASLIAYGFILGRYKAKSKRMKTLFPIAGFIAACFAHGFYDFWLISPAVQFLNIFTTVFFVLSVHVWFQFMNNAMNNSPFFVARSFNPIIQLDMLSIGIVSLLALEYLVINNKFGTKIANEVIQLNGWIVPVFLIYVTVLFSEFKAIPGRWKKFKFNIPRAFSFFKNAGRFTNESSFQDTSYEGLQLRLFVQKSNRYVADKFPVSGYCERLITVSGSENWSLFRLESDFNYSGYRSDYVIIRTKEPSDSLSKDKVEILLLFVPLGTPLNGQSLETSQLRFTGRAFARSI